jgi:site-specific DNA-methyltransferase (adenine-specific)
MEFLGRGGFGTKYLGSVLSQRAMRLEIFQTAAMYCFAYTKGDDWTFNQLHVAHDPAYVKKFYRHVDLNGRRYRLGDLTNPNKDRPNLTYDFLGVRRVWRWTRDRMEQAYAKGLIVQSRPGAIPQAIRYLDDMAGTPVTDELG